MNRRAASRSLAIALGLAALAPASVAFAQPVPMKEGMEKCFGIAAKAKNDCAAGAHSSGQATKDRDPASFVMLPAGACGKISGGKLTAA